MSEGQGSAPDFTLAGLRRTLEDLVRLGYEFVSFTGDVDPAAAHILLRHDIDVDLHSATIVAEIEATMGVRSTFFFLLTSDLYNLRSSIGRQCLERVRSLGHEIGLHFDASLSNGGAAAGDRLRREQRALEELAGCTIRTFSLHKPGTDTSFEDAAPTLENAYADRFFRDIGYVADSMGWWRFGRPAQQRFITERAAGQIVIHPIWWTTDTPVHPATRLEMLLDRRQRADQGSLADTVQPYGEWLAGRTTHRWAWDPDLRGGGAAEC